MQNYDYLVFGSGSAGLSFALQVSGLLEGLLE